MRLSPRLTAALTVLLLIGGIALVAIKGTAFAGTYLNSDANTGHDAGKIVRIDTKDLNFWLLTSKGQTVEFECSERCMTALPHMLRHKREGAATDVYFVRLMNNTLMALDVD
ncbi:MAG TPA: hypothetical protein DHW02_14855 [Ktedonobacter sp.]|nr:hypothetical protein [Ktedonobacter sp.]